MDLRKKRTYYSTYTLSYEILTYTGYLSVGDGWCKRKTEHKTTKPINAGQSITRTVEAKVKYCNLLHYKIFTTLLCKQFNVTARVKLTTDVQSFACIPLKISIYIFYLHGEEIATFLFPSIYCYSLLQSLN